MALVITDACDDISTLSSGSPTISAGRSGLGFSGATEDVIAGYDFADLGGIVGADTLTIGFAFRFSAYPVSPLSPAFIELLDDQGNIQNQLQLTSTGAMTLTRGTTNLTTTVAIVAPNTWYYIQLAIRLHDSAGSVVMRRDATLVMSASGVDTKPGSTTTYNVVNFLGIGTSITVRFDDIYICTAATTPDAFFGLTDICVRSLYPNGNGDSSQWVGSDGDSTDNYLLVDEVGSPGSDYVSESVSGDTDLYTFHDLTGIGTIYAVTAVNRVSKSDVGIAAFQAAIKRSSVNVSATNNVSVVSARTFYNCWTTDPETGLAWTIANVSALQAGVKQP